MNQVPSPDNNMAGEPNDDKRTYTRFAVALDVQVSFERGNGVLKTRDISDGGVFLILDEQDFELPPLGTRVQLQVQNPLMGDDPPPIVEGEVVRRTEEGIGVRFIETP